MRPAESILGWNTRVAKTTSGGSKGYRGGICAGPRYSHIIQTKPRHNQGIETDRSGEAEDARRVRRVRRAFQRGLEAVAGPRPLRRPARGARRRIGGELRHLACQPRRAPGASGPLFLARNFL